MRDFLLVYDNSSYLDKLLETSFFSLKSSHFQTLLGQVRLRAKEFGVELRGRLFCDHDCQLSNCPESLIPEKDNIHKLLKLESKVNAEIQHFKESGEPSSAVVTPDSPDDSSMHSVSNENLCIELLSMLKSRMDLAYAEIVSRIGGSRALSVMTNASENVVPVSFASIPNSPDESFNKNSCAASTPLVRPLCFEEIAGVVEQYSVIDDAPNTHHYFSDRSEPVDKNAFLRVFNKEIRLLKEGLPAGVWIKSYGNRTDLLSVMIRGPNKTPYEDGLFLFDIKLGAQYPKKPPSCHFISYSSERLNPNLYVEGKVCISLLGTWMGRGTEVWGPSSTLLQLIVSIQGLILVAEPYYNEAGYEKQLESQQGYENSRTYNELVILKLVQSMTEMLLTPPTVFTLEVLTHFKQNGEKFCERLESWLTDPEPMPPGFPLLPISKGLKLSLNSTLKSFKSVLNTTIAPV